MSDPETPAEVSGSETDPLRSQGPAGERVLIEDDLGEYDIYVSYAAADRDVVDALVLALQARGLSVWRDARGLAPGRGLSQTMLQALDASRLALAVWTSAYTRSGYAPADLIRARTLGRPVVAATVGDRAAMDGFSPTTWRAIDGLAKSVRRPGFWPFGPAKQAVSDALDRLAGTLWTEIGVDQAGQNTGLVPVSERPRAFNDLLEEAAIVASRETRPNLSRALFHGDRASAVTVMRAAGYTKPEIDALIAPDTLELAPEGGETTDWGAWRIRPAAPPQPEPENPAGTAVAALLLGGLVGAGIVATALGLTGGERGGERLVAEAAQTCRFDADGNPVALPCRIGVPADLQQPQLRAEAAPPPRMSGDMAQLAACKTPEPGGRMSAPCRITEDVTTTYRACTPGAAPFDAIPCTLTRQVWPESPAGAPPAPAPVSVAADPLQACRIAPSGAVAAVPCRLETAMTARPDPAPALSACTVGTDGAVGRVPCRLETRIAAPPAPAPALTPCRISADGAVTGAPCRLGENLAARPVRASAPEPDPASSEPDPPVLINALSGMEDCINRGAPPCLLRVEDSGFFTLTGIAKAYYGDEKAYCSIFQHPRNNAVFGSRPSWRQRNDPNCIWKTDTFWLPAPAANGGYDRCTPPAQKPLTCWAGGR